MKNTGRHSENSGYLVTLLLMVGLTAFSQSMKELTEIHQLTLDASRLVAQWSGNVTPAAVPQAPQVAQTIVRIEKHESCQIKQSAPAVELPWLSEQPAVVPVRKQIKNESVVRISRAAIPSEDQACKLKKLQRIDINADAFEVRVPAVQIPDSGESVTTEFPAFTFKTKPRKPGATRINPRDREMILKTLNRSINLRIAS